MAAEDHKRLANIVKGIHQNLRFETYRVGAENAWVNHCSREDVLKMYADAMKQLATEFWTKSVDDLSNEKAKCRVKWIIDQCNSYYFLGGNTDALIREKMLCSKHGLENFIENSTPSEQILDKLRVLDVGSCYNPFKSLPRLDVIPVDIAPATNDVFQCDFLNVPISQKLSISHEKKVIELQELYFDVVIFSLLLEYFPSPKQRFSCCKKAYEVLKPGGIICIVTPDSKHATANAKIMKMWRYALADIGFSRLSYDKLPHLHCMVYRKCFNPKLSRQWLSLTLNSNFKKGKSEVLLMEQLMAIPQDNSSKEYDIKESTSYARDGDDDIASGFEDLPLTSIVNN